MWVVVKAAGLILVGAGLGFVAALLLPRRSALQPPAVERY